MSFGDYDLGVEITVNDLIPNSTHSGGSPARGIAGEDDETERDGGLLTYTDQWWDLEGMFWNADSRTLSVVGGFDYLRGVKGESLGDLVYRRRGVSSRCSGMVQTCSETASRAPLMGAFETIERNRHQTFRP